MCSPSIWRKKNFKRDTGPSSLLYTVINSWEERKEAKVADFPWVQRGAGSDLERGDHFVRSLKWRFLFLLFSSLLFSGGYSHLISWLHHELEACSFVQQLYRVPKTLGARLCIEILLVRERVPEILTFIFFVVGTYRVWHRTTCWEVIHQVPKGKKKKGRCRCRME